MKFTEIRIFILILTMFISSIVLSQIPPHCGSQNEELDICSHGEISIPNYFQTIGAVNITVVDNSGDMLFTVVGIGDGNTITFFIPEDAIIPNSGNLYINPDSDPSLFCHTHYDLIQCYDILIPEEDVICATFNTYSNNYTYTLINYCVGDTIRFNLSARNISHNENPHYPFNPDRLDLPEGILIVNYSDDFVDLLLNTSSDISFAFYTISESNHNFDFQYLSFSHSLEKKHLEISSKGNDNAESAVICTEEEVLLQNLSQDFNNSEWVFDGEIISTDNEVSLTFDTEGDYEIILRDIDICGCTTPDTILIDVLAGDSPKIDCISTSCIGDTVSYYSANDCGQYIWDIPGSATIISGGTSIDSYVELVWNDASDTEVQLSNPGCFISECRSTISTLIPIIGNDISIQGKTVVCGGEFSRYIQSSNTQASLLDLLYPTH